MEKTLFINLFNAKKEIGKITKDSKNPFFKSNYLSLNGLIESISEPLINNGLVFIQPIEDGILKTKIINVNDGELVSSEMVLPDLKDPQKLGSAITYYRRYTLQSLLGLQAEDDDGNSAKPKPKPVELPPITEADMDKLKLPANIKHIDWYLTNRKPTAEQLKVLTELKNK